MAKASRINYRLCLPLVKIEKGRGSQYLLLYLILLLSLDSFNQHSLNLYYMQLTMCLRMKCLLFCPLVVGFAARCKFYRETKECLPSPSFMDQGASATVHLLLLKKKYCYFTFMSIL